MGGLQRVKLAWFRGSQRALSGFGDSKNRGHFSLCGSDSSEIMPFSARRPRVSVLNRAGCLKKRFVFELVT
jgi:hypothetical protein